MPETRVTQNEINDVQQNAEVKIGTWVDGSSLYRKSAEGASIAALATALGTLTGFSKIIDIRMVVRNTSDNGWRQVPWLFNTTASSDWYAGCYITSAGVLSVQAGAQIGSVNFAVITVEYTK